MASFKKKYESWRRTPGFKNQAPAKTLELIPWANAYRSGDDDEQPISDEDQQTAIEVLPAISLPKEMQPRMCICEGYIPPLVHYGIVISRDTLGEYAQEYDIIDIVPVADAPSADADYDMFTDDGRVASTLYTITRAQKHLNNRLGPCHTVKIELCHGCKYGVFTFFNNYDRREERPPMDHIKELAKDFGGILAWYLDERWY